METFMVPGFLFYLKILCLGPPGWLSQLSCRLLIPAQVMISRFVGSSNKVGSALTALSLFGIVSLSFSAPPPLARARVRSLSLSLKINKKL